MTVVARAAETSLAQGKEVEKEKEASASEWKRDALRPLAVIMEDLRRRVPGRVLKTRVEPSGMELSYIPWYYANQMLSFYAPGWHGEVRSVLFGPQNQSVTVVYRVTINGTDGSVYRESTGTADIPGDGYGDPVQKAEGMAFRRCCARMGLGLYLYTDEKL